MSENQRWLDSLKPELEFKKKIQEQLLSSRLKTLERLEDLYFRLSERYELALNDPRKTIAPSLFLQMTSVSKSIDAEQKAIAALASLDKLELLAALAIVRAAGFVLFHDEIDEIETT